jgi:TonB-dependent starch-binding outer membrane protein SusC
MRNNCIKPHTYVRQAKILALWKVGFFLLLFTAQVRANDGYAQNTVTLTEKNVPISKVLKKIQRQTGYTYFAPVSLLQKAKNISIDVKDVSLTYALDKIFDAQPLTYKIVQKVIIVQEKGEGVGVTPVGNSNAGLTIGTDKDVRGRITDADGEPIAGANVSVKGTNKVVVTDKNGDFVLTDVPGEVELEITYVGYEKKIVLARSGSLINTSLAISTKELDVAVVQAYGVTTRRQNTGNISKVTSDEISRQPVSNVLNALQARVPGMVVSQTNGVAGSHVKLEIRGRSSLDFSLSRNDPLIIIDGVPFEAGNQPYNRLVSAAEIPVPSQSESGLSALYSINPMDIESVEILKDADATAIYGSRGANGVILITTKKGRSGKTRVSVNIRNGWNRITRHMEMLNTQQYIQMRREGFANDNLLMTNSNAPDVRLWDTTRYTDFQRLLIGNVGQITNIQLSLSGGNAQSKFHLSPGYSKETSVYSTEFTNTRASLKLDIGHESIDKRFNVALSAIYSSGKNKLPKTDVSKFINLPPNLLLYDSLGNLAWQEKGVNFSNFNGFTNPLADYLKKYTATSENLSANLLIVYKILDGLAFKGSFGYNKFNVDEVGITPKASISPTSSTLASSNFAFSNSKSWIIEPQLEFTRSIGQSKLTALVGTTWQDKVYKSNSIAATNYTSDLLLYSMDAAGALNTSSIFSEYKYTAAFGRLNLNHRDKYILNGTFRRDGTTRFASVNRFANFAAVGAAWIFSAEPFIQDKLGFLSFGKLRGSYGTSGNDQIGDYSYLQLWQSTNNPYQAIPGLQPTRLFNPDYTWELTKKMEGAIELGLFKDRLLFSAAYYRHRSSNQLISYRLPVQTGFQNIVKNLPASVQNSGWEFTLTSKNVTSKQFKWSSSFNMTVQRNKLLSFPNLSTSTYASLYEVGRPLDIVKGFKYLGVDPATGVFSFQDVNKDGQLTAQQDYQILRSLAPDFMGGMENTFTFNNWRLDVFFQFVKKIDRNYLFDAAGAFPGAGYNQPTLVLDRWQKPGDVTFYQRYSASTSSPAVLANVLYLPYSDAAYTDASFIRLKTLSISYKVPSSITNILRIEGAQFFFQAQNLLTITNYDGPDPETAGYFQLPPLKTIAFGLNVNL